MSIFSKAMGVAIAIFAVTAFAAGSASAQESPTSAWGSVWKRDQAKRQNDLIAAQLSETAAKRGFGAASSSSTVNIGTQTNYETHTGPETDASAINIVNSSTITNTATGTGIVITTGSSQTSGTATQGATAQTASSSGSGTVSTTATGHNN